MNFFETLTTESFVAKVLIFHSFFEDKVKILIENRLFHINSQADKNKLFSGYGPLSSHSARLLIAYHLGWISPKLFEKINLVRKLRNFLGHHGFETSNNQNKIDNWLSEIKMDYEEYIEIIYKDLERESDQNIPRNRTAEQDMLCNFALIAATTFENLLVLPFAISEKIHPKHIALDYDKAPEKIRQIRLWLPDSLIAIISQNS